MKKCLFALVLMVVFTSCYSYHSVVGSGSSLGVSVTEKNHYLFAGFEPLAVSNSQKMSSGSENYVIYTRQSFVDVLVSVLTSGIYTPTTTTVTR